jgi:hypothetical protein
MIKPVSKNDLIFIIFIRETALPYNQLTASGCLKRTHKQLTEKTSLASDFLARANSLYIDLSRDLQSRIQHFNKLQIDPESNSGLLGFG